MFKVEDKAPGKKQTPSYKKNLNVTLRSLDFSQRLDGKLLNILEKKNLQGESTLFLGFYLFIQLVSFLDFVEKGINSHSLNFKRYKGYMVKGLPCFCTLLPIFIPGSRSMLPISYIFFQRALCL